MNIKTDFLNALMSAPKVFSDFHADNFLGEIYDTNGESDSPFFSVLSGGNIAASFPFSFDISSLDCYMLLYTKSGCGKLLKENHVHTLSASSLLFLDCHQRFRLDIATAPWEYQVLFVAGKALSYYYDMIPDQVAIMPLSTHSEIIFHLDKLLLFAKGNSLSSRLAVSSLIDTVITTCILHFLPENDNSPQAAPYLREMKELFDSNFRKNYSLDELEEYFHIGKYKLCREFAKAFGMPPLQYLNRRRIESARHLLLTTTLKVHEVGSRVGIDNTNHFISLFKKYTGLTPLAFRQKGNAMT